MERRRSWIITLIILVCLTVLLCVNAYAVDDDIQTIEVIDYTSVTMDEAKTELAEKCSTDYGYLDIVNNIGNQAMVALYEAIDESLGDDVKELLCFKLAGIYRDEFENYIGADKDFNAYYEQTVERDSREWAESRLETEYGEYVFQTQE